MRKFLPNIIWFLFATVIMLILANVLFGITLVLFNLENLNGYSIFFIKAIYHFISGLMAGLLVDKIFEIIKGK